MGLQDFTYRLKAQSGDTAPHDELSVSADLSGGTITLVDRGSGDYAWRFVGAAIASAVSQAINTSTAADGVTIAIRMAVTNYGSTDFALLAGYIPSGQTTQGVNITRTTANIQRYRYDTSTTPTQTLNTAIRTIVIKVAITTGTDQVYVWIDDAGRSGTTPTTQFASAQSLTSRTLNELRVGSTGTTIEVTDLLVWAEELSDADCTALADDGIRATLDGAGGITGTFAVTEALDTAALAGDVFVAGSLAATEALDVAAFTGGAGRSGDLAVTEALDTAAFSGGSAAITGTMAATEALDTAAATGAVRWNGIAGDPIKNPAGTLLASVTIAKVAFVRVSDMSVVLSLADQVTNGSGLLPVYNAALVNGVPYIRLLSDATGANVGAKTFTAA